MNIERPFQRKRSLSNAHVGREFEHIAKNFFLSKGLLLESNFLISIGIGEVKKEHAFDLGNKTEQVIVECKSHTWTEGGKVPSAKLTVWNEAMYYFFLAPKDYRKIMFVQKDIRPRTNETLVDFYIRTYPHLIPHNVEFWEYDVAANLGREVNIKGK